MRVFLLFKKENWEDGGIHYSLLLSHASLDHPCFLLIFFLFLIVIPLAVWQQLFVYTFGIRATMSPASTNGLP